MAGAFHETSLLAEDMEHYKQVVKELSSAKYQGRGYAYGGTNKTASCRAKLNELLEFIKMQVMTEAQIGIALGIEAWTKGEFNLTDE